jgi:hypothetical protein
MAPPQQIMDVRHTLALHQYDPHVHDHRVKLSPDHPIPLAAAATIAVRSHEHHNLLIHLTSGMYHPIRVESI